MEVGRVEMRNEVIEGSPLRLVERGARSWHARAGGVLEREEFGHRRSNAKVEICIFFGFAFRRLNSNGPHDSATTGSATDSAAAETAPNRAHGVFERVCLRDDSQLHLDYSRSRADEGNARLVRKRREQEQGRKGRQLGRTRRFRGDKESVDRHVRQSGPGYDPTRRDRY